MHRRVNFIALAVLIAGLAQAEVITASLTYYNETIDLGADGGATVTVRCCLPGLSPEGAFPLPYAFSSWPDSFVPGGALREVFSRTVHDRRRLYVAVTGIVTEKDTLEYRFHVPDASTFGRDATGDFGNRSIAYRLVQSSDSPVALMSVRILLPEGVAVNRIVATTPAGKSNSAQSPFAIGKLNGRHCVTLTDSSVGQGDVLSLVFEAKPEARSPLILVALVLGAVVYLILFRDLLKPGQPQSLRLDPQK